MKKIVKLYEDNKIIFCIIIMFWVEIITEICASFLVYLWNKSWNGWGNPSNTRITNAGDIVSYVSISVFVLLVVVPVIIMVIALVKHLYFKMNVVPFLIIVIVAFMIGLFFSNIHDEGLSKLVYSFIEHLNDKYILIEEGYISF